MDKTTVRIRIIAALGMNSRQYRNFTRALFELWATVIARQQNLLLESITTNISLWHWYIDEFELVERRFYNENSAYIDSLLDAAILNDVLISMAEEIEEIYPSVLIKMYCNENDDY
ncbi:hypothetical protein [Empedobacter sp. GD03739]|uniref:hypothetical protein n=1 Tax=Empedobacter sp. GD03739 TaxID=2975376 RepID=UPI002448B84F|nr:hypothetical protein [Empedobacter sp. GD03739]MDH1602596.1 hypothetical protein [Empedobacter sp. GD03739]